MITQTISLNALTLYGFHGLHTTEGKTGSWFTFSVSVTIPAPVIPADFSATINYADLYAICCRASAIPVPLLETLARNILNETLNLAPGALAATVSVNKLHPPLGGQVANASVSLHYTQE